MSHRIIFLLLIVSSLYCNFNRCAVCFQSFSVNIAFTSTQTAARAWQAQKGEGEGEGEGGGGNARKRGKGKGAPAIRAGVFVFRPPFSQLIR